MTLDELRAKAAEQRRHRRGRPWKVRTEISWMDQRVWEVFELEHEFRKACRRGALTKAIRQVGDREKLPFETFRQHVHRNRHLRVTVELWRIYQPQFDQLEEAARQFGRMVEPWLRQAQEAARLLDAHLGPYRKPI